MKLTRCRNVLVPEGMVTFIKECQHRGVHFNDVYRTYAEQKRLYDNYLAGKGPPANPPNYGTHRLKSDAVAYRGPAGRSLSTWQVGLDVETQQRFRRVCRVLGVDIFNPYSYEPWHFNLERKIPRVKTLRWKYWQWKRTR